MTHYATTLSEEWQQIQGHISQRAQISQYINNYIHQQYAIRRRDRKQTPLADVSTHCEITWELLFDENFPHIKDIILHRFNPAKHLGTGSYGRVFSAHFKLRGESNRVITPRNHWLSWPVAIKLTKDMSEFEVRTMIKTSSLVQAEISPHFITLYGSFICNSRKYQPSSQVLARFPSLTMLYEQYKKHKQWDILHRPGLPHENPHHSDLMQTLASYCPTLEELHYIRQKIVTHKFEWLHNPHPTTTTTTTTTTDSPTLSTHLTSMTQIDELEHLYNLAIKQRLSMEHLYEMIIMERAHHNLYEWVSKSHSINLWCSLIVQVIMGCLSLQSYCDVIQNDLTWKNIVYNQVDSTIRYCYQIGNTFFDIALHGHLFKIIDFGLSVSTQEWPNLKMGDLKRWCVDGDLDNNRWHNSDTKWCYAKCSFVTRDINEFIYNLLQLKNTIPPGLHQWLNDTRSMLIKFSRNNPHPNPHQNQTTLENLVNIVIVPRLKTLTQLEPQTVKVLTEEPSMSHQKRAFCVCLPKNNSSQNTIRKYRQVLHKHSWIQRKLFAKATNSHFLEKSDLIIA
jgi:hypothetical protein